MADRQEEIQIAGHAFNVSVSDSLRAVADFPTLARAVLIWLVFTVCISIVPFPISWIAAATQDQPMSLALVGGHGEFLLVAVAIQAAGIGDLLRCRMARHGTLWVGLMGAGFLEVVAAVWYFADVSGIVRTGGHLDTKVVAVISSLLLLAAILVGASCVVLAERQR